MDCGKVYIKMCEKAKRIQDEHGEAWITFGKGILYSYDNVYYKHLTEDGNRWHLTWLPRQDQLQGMVGNYEEAKRKIKSFFYDWAEFTCPFAEDFNYDDSYWESFASMEQLWLAFVMFELHGKRWDGEKWNDA